MMSRWLVIRLVLAFLPACLCTLAAKRPVPTAEELNLRPGDKIAHTGNPGIAVRAGLRLQIMARSLQTYDTIGEQMRKMFSAFQKQIRLIVA